MKKSFILATFLLTFVAVNAQKVAGSKMTWVQLYPILKKSLLESTCEPCILTDEGESFISVNSQESDFFLSSWVWDLVNRPLIIKDIDNDGLIDYTIEMSNEGGGCGGQVGLEERWTLFGSDPTNFIFTHLIPYRSETRDWVEY
jgi:hypothetical protein